MKDNSKAQLVTLVECPIGLFWADDTLCLKTEYGNNEGRIDAYIVESGEFFWGAAPQTIASQRAQLVCPLDTDEVLAALTRPQPSIGDMGAQQVTSGDRVVILRENESGSNWLRPGALATVDYLLPDYGKVICKLDEPVGPHKSCCLYNSQFGDHWKLADAPDPSGRQHKMTDSSVEAVARAIYEQHGKRTPWDMVHEQHKALWRNDARAAIAAYEAALPSPEREPMREASPDGR